jgi:Tfp pilus assembly protein PilF
MTKLSALVALLPALLLSAPAFAQKDVVQAKTTEAKKTMTWTTKSAQARELAGKAADHYMNAEHEEAYKQFSNALKLDPEFTIALAYMANLTKGEVKKTYVQKTLKSAANKTEGEKLFASLVEPGIDAAKRRDIVAQLRLLYPDGAMINTMYVNTRETPEERFEAAQEFLKRFPDKAWIHNSLGYMYLLDKKDNDMSKKHFEKYIEMYPQGYNPYDSMGEYYLTIGDNENAEKYYTLALEKAPFNHSSLAAMEKINEAKKKKSADKQ